MANLKWKNGKCYDFGTSNLSFLQVAKDLKTVGIKNFYFMLELKNPALAGINPYADEVAGNKEKNIPANDPICVAILTECIQNPWYFVREVARIPVAGTSGVKFLLNRATCAVFWCFLNNIDSYITISRQIGKTESIITILDWAFNFGASNTQMGFLNYDQTKASDNLDKLKVQYKLLPEYLRLNFTFNEETNKKKEMEGNVRSYKNIRNGNVINTKSKATSKEAAMKIGRGSTEAIFYSDETEFTNWIDEIMASNGPAFVTAHDNAVNNNSASARIFSSTPGDLDAKAGKEAQRILKETVKWSESFYDKDPAEVREFVETNSKNRIVYIEYPYYLLGKGEKYYRDQVASLSGDKIRIRREILLQRIHGSSDSPFDPEDLEKLNDLKGSVVEEYFLLDGNYKLDVYTPLIRDRIYFMGIDVADSYGADSDSNAIEIFDPYTFKTVAEFKSPYISPPNLVRLVLQLMRKFIPNAIIIPERNKGAALIASLLETPVRDRIYKEEKNTLNQFEKLDRQGYLEWQAQSRRDYGVWTGAKSRTEMYRLLEALVRENKEAFVTDGLINEIMGLVTKNGKIQAVSPNHDDCVMAWLMNIFVYYYGNNLQRFGFIKGELPAEERQNKGLETFEDVYEALDEDSKKYFATAKRESINMLDQDFIEQLQQERVRSSYATNHMDTITRVEEYTVADEYSDAYGDYNNDFYRELNDF